MRKLEENASNFEQNLKTYKMKKHVLIYGIIAGFITTAWMIGMIASGNSEIMENGEIYGYSIMLLAFSMIFVGIKNYRDKHNEGLITFGKAFKLGLLITLVASTIYVLVWLIDYYFFIPDFMDKYATMMLEKLKAKGMSQTELDAKALEMAQFKEMYKNPFFNAMITYTEILPVGLIMSLIAALVFKRKVRVVG